MKKSMLFAAAAVVAMVGCTNEDFTGFQQTEKGEMAINFGSVGKTITRADKTGKDAADLLGGNFVVEGFKSNGYTDGSYADQTVVFDHYNVNWADNTANSTASNSANWEYVGQDVNLLTSLPTQTIKYWDYNFTQYDFIAFSKGKENSGKVDTYFKTVQIANVGKAVDATGAGAVLMTQEKHVSELTNMYIADLVTSYKNSTTASNSEFYYQGTVIPKFRRLGAKIRMAIYETVPGYSVKDVKFYPAESGTTQDKATLYVNGTSTLASGNGTMYVYYPTVGADKTTDPDYNQAHVVFKAATSGTTATNVNFDELTGFAEKELYEATGTKFLGRTSAEATYAGDYQMVLPTGTGNVLTLKVDYTLEAIDGSKEDIKVKAASAIVPAIYTEWQPNYAYTYIFKISDQSNGTAGTVGADPAGLYPITFDAVVAADVDGGIQETITEVGVPAITTYQKGKIVTENDEYSATDGKIYAVVNELNADGTDKGTVQTLTATATNGNTVGFAQLFTATTSGAIETITEKTANNCFVNGKVTTDGFEINPDANGGTYTLTKSDAMTIVAKIPAAAAPHGVDITVSAAEITPTANTVFVLQTLTKAGTYAAVPSTQTQYHEGETYYDGTTFARLEAKAASTDLSNYYVVDPSNPGTPDVYNAVTSGTFSAASKIHYYKNDGTTYVDVTANLRDGDDLTQYKEGSTSVTLYTKTDGQPATYIAATGFYDAAIATEAAYTTKYYELGADGKYTEIPFADLSAKFTVGENLPTGAQTCDTPAKYAYKVIRVK